MSNAPTAIPPTLDYGLPPRRDYRRIAKWAIAVLFVAITVAAAFPAYTAARRYAEYRRAYNQGVAEAKAELQAGNATYYGGTDGGLGPAFHPGTGLPVTPIFACVIDNATEGRLAGHNDTIKAHIRAKGLPAYSRKAWLPEVSDPRTYFKRQSERQPPRPLRLDGVPEPSPGGTTRLQFRTTPAALRTPWTPDVEIVLVRGASQTRTDPSVLGSEDQAVVVCWGPPGSDLAFLHVGGVPTVTEPCDVYLVLDLRTGQYLNYQFR